ncbi:hypothetical protein NRS6120_16615 [Bacillus subtilis]|nr:hypothetical protein NRS6120_01640 [Bacillus subtilis]CAI6303264.1 hypothetical protein NRS6120_16615 [Bacillus subtilis]
MGALFLHLKPDEYLKKLYKTKKLVEKTSFSLQAEDLSAGAERSFLLICFFHSWTSRFIEFLRFFDLSSFF